MLIPVGRYSWLAFSFRRLDHETNGDPVRIKNPLSFFSLKINHLKSPPSILLRSLSTNCNVQMFNYDSTSIEYFFVLFRFFFGEGVHESYHSNTTAYEEHPPPPLQSSLRALFEVVPYNQNQSNFSNN